MQGVAAVGYGGTKFSPESHHIEDELCGAASDLFSSTNLAPKDVDAVLVSTNDHSRYLAPILCELVGIKPRIAHTVENMCSSGASAIIAGASYIASGLARTVLIAGAEMLDSPGSILEWDASRGQFARPVFWASIFTKAYKRRFDISSSELASIPAKNHRNASLNPLAYQNGSPTISDILDSREVTKELNIYDCSRPCTGASAVLLSSRDTASEITDVPVSITGTGQRTLGASFGNIKEYCTMEATAAAGADALHDAKKNAAEIDVAEVHDAFSVCEAMALEDLGIAKRGKGAAMASELYETGDNRINPRGGLIGAGHPLGATGIAQAAEVIAQLQGKAQKRQVAGARTGLVHNMSAAATSASVLVLES